MKPILFEFGPFAVTSYWVMLTTAALALLAGSYLTLRRHGVPLSVLVFWGAMGYALALVTAHLVSMALNLDQLARNLQQYGWGALLPRSGLSYHGSLVGVLFAIWGFSREAKIPFLTCLDAVAPYGALGIALGRWGCFLNGCCWGVETDKYFGAVFPPGPWHQEEVFRHASQLYESLLSLFLFLGLLAWQPRAKGRGAVFSLFLIGSGSIRFLVEYSRWGGDGGADRGRSYSGAACLASACRHGRLGAFGAAVGKHAPKGSR